MMISATSSDIRDTKRADETSVARDTSPISARIGQPGGSHEELLEEVLGKQVLQIVVHAFVFVRRTGLAHAEDRQAEMLHLDARLDGRPPRIVAALRVPIAVRCAPVMMMIAWRTRGLGLARSPITPAEFPGSVKSRPILSLAWLGDLTRLDLSRYDEGIPRENSSYSVERCDCFRTLLPIVGSLEIIAK